MMQLQFSANPDGWVKGLCGDCSAHVKILGLKSAGGRKVAHFVEITTAAGTTDAVKEWLGKTGTVDSIELTDLAKDHLLGVVVARGCGVCASLIDSSSASFISLAATEADCNVGYKLYLGGDGVPSLLNSMTGNGVEYAVREISAISDDSPLTVRQFSVLKSAMEMGLYDFPRRMTQDELAVRLSIKPSTLNEILRRAEKKILGAFLGEQRAVA